MGATRPSQIPHWTERNTEAPGAISRAQVSAHRGGEGSELTAERTAGDSAGLWEGQAMANPSTSQIVDYIGT